MATIEQEQIRALSGWEPRGDSISKTFHFDDFGDATRFVGRIALDAAVACREPLIGIRGGRVTVTFAPRDGSPLTLDDVIVARRIQRLLGDHRHPVGRAGPWSPAAGSAASAHARWGRPARNTHLRPLAIRSGPRMASQPASRPPPSRPSNPSGATFL